MRCQAIWGRRADLQGEGVREHLIVANDVGVEKHFEVVVEMGGR